MYWASITWSTSLYSVWSRLTIFDLSEIGGLTPFWVSQVNPLVLTNPLWFSQKSPSDQLWFHSKSSPVDRWRSMKVKEWSWLLQKYASSHWFHPCINPIYTYSSSCFHDLFAHFSQQIRIYHIVFKRQIIFLETDQIRKREGQRKDFFFMVQRWAMMPKRPLFWNCVHTLYTFLDFLDIRNDKIQILHDYQQVKN